MTDQEIAKSTRLRPEEKELARLEARIEELQEQLADRLLEQATLRRELRDFEQRFLAVVGTRQAELDQLEARIAALLAASRPSPEAEGAAQAAAERARLSAEEIGDADALRQSIPEMLREIPEELRSIFRQVAKAVHPDFAVDDSDRAERERAMSEANAAYEAGDVSRLRQVFDQWESRPEAVQGDDVGSRIVRAIRRIAEAEKRLEEIAAETDLMRSSDLAGLQARTHEALAEGRDLLQEMADELERRIAAANLQMRELVDAAEQRND